MTARTLHLCLDVTADRVELARALLQDSPSRSVECLAALTALSEAIADAPVVPAAMLAQVALSEEPGKGLRFTPENAPKLVTVCVSDMLKIAPGARVARVAVVAHLIDEGDEDGGR